MKSVHLAFAAVLAGIFLQAGPVAAQGSSAYSKEAIDNLVGLLKEAEKDGYKMESGTVNIFGGWLKKGDGKGDEPWVDTLTLSNLDSNKKYRIIAAGDNDAIDLDLRVLRVRVADPNNVVASDETVDRNAKVTLEPKKDQQKYLIQMRLYKSRDNCVCIGYILVK